MFVCYKSDTSLCLFVINQTQVYVCLLLFVINQTQVPSPIRRHGSIHAGNRLLRVLFPAPRKVERHFVTQFLKYLPDMVDPTLDEVISCYREWQPGNETMGGVMSVEDLPNPWTVLETSDVWWLRTIWWARRMIGWSNCLPKAVIIADWASCSEFDWKKQRAADH